MADQVLLCKTGAIPLQVHCESFYEGPCFICKKSFSEWFPLRLRGNSETIYFCDYACLEEYRKGPARFFSKSKKG